MLRMRDTLHETNDVLSRSKRVRTRAPHSLLKRVFETRSPYIHSFAFNVDFFFPSSLCALRACVLSAVSMQLLGRMRTRLVTNKLITGLIILTELGIAGLVIYIKWYT
jgi:hypothetical protein